MLTVHSADCIAECALLYLLAILVKSKKSQLINQENLSADRLVECALVYHSLTLSAKLANQR